MDFAIQHKENDRRGVFFIEAEEGIISELTYSIKDDNVLIVDHTETKRSLEGQGFASKLLAHTVSYARNNDFKIYPLCPFAEVKFDEHPEYSDVRAS